MNELPVDTAPPGGTGSTDDNAGPAGYNSGALEGDNSGVHEGGGLSPVDIVELETVWVAAIRSVVAAEDVPEFMSDALSLVAATLREAGLAPAGPPFARYFAAGPDGLDMAAGFPVAEPFLRANVVRPGELPAGPAAVATHVGSHTGLEAAWSALRERADAMDRQLGDDPWEVYFIGPGSGVDEAEWRTELVWPLRG